MKYPIEVTGLGVDYGSVRALDDVTVNIAPGTIVGLLGRNGAGKTTLLETLAAYRRPARGRVLVDGEDPYENARRMRDTVLIRDHGDFDGSSKVADVLEITSSLRPRWDGDYADRLLDRFSLDRNKRAGALSTGMRSALAVSIGLATRAPLTMFDEPHLGMDAPSRYVFYEELLADFIEHSRTILLSTHLIDEVARLLEQIVILEEGRVLIDEPAAELQGRGAEITGASGAVDAFVDGMTVLAKRQLGPTKSVVVDANLDKPRRDAAAASGLDIGPIPLQELFVHLTTKETRR